MSIDISALSAEQVAALLRLRGDKVPAKHLEAATDLPAKFYKWGWSDRQLRYARSLVAMALGQVTPPKAQTAPKLGDPSALFHLFDSQVGRIKFPKLRLSTPVWCGACKHIYARAAHSCPECESTDRRGGYPLVVYQAGQRSKHPGDLMVTDGRPFGEGTYYGRIDREGQLFASREMHREVQRYLELLVADPTREAALVGIRLGSCCFCGRALEDGRSVAMGYGPICAENYGLDWGQVRTNALGETVPA